MSVSSLCRRFIFSSTCSSTRKDDVARPRSGGRWLRGVVVAARPEGHGLKREGNAEDAKDRDAPYSRDRACSTELKLYWREKETMSRHGPPRSRRASRDVQLGGGVNCRQESGCP